MKKFFKGCINLIGIDEKTAMLCALFGNFNGNLR